MAKLEWGSAGSKLFETGLDRGVLYISGLGVAWTGLLSVDLAANNEVNELYFNGMKLMDLVSVGDVTGTIRAVSYPDAFLELQGTLEDSTGLAVHDQPLLTFSLSYRTLLGNDIVGEQYGYKIHVLYNVTASPNSLSYETINDGVNPVEFEWDISTIPESAVGYRPTAHVVFDSTKIPTANLQSLEDLLYGTATTNPTLPSIETLMDAAATIMIVDNGDGTWTATGPDAYITMLDADSFQITNVNAVYLSADEYKITST